MVQEKCLQCGYWNNKVNVFNTCRVFPTCPAASPRLAEMTIGSFVWLENDRVEKISKIKKRYDEFTGKQFTVIELESGRDFHGDTGVEYFPRPKGEAFIAVGKAEVVPVRRKNPLQNTPVVTRKKERNEKSIVEVSTVIRRKRG